MTTLLDMARETAAALNNLDETMLSKITIEFALVDSGPSGVAIVTTVTSHRAGVTASTGSSLAGALRDVEAWSRRISGAGLTAELSTEADILASRLRLAIDAI